MAAAGVVGDAVGDATGAGLVAAGDVAAAVEVLKAAADGRPEPELCDEFPPLATPEQAQASNPITPSPASSVKNRRCQ